MIRRLLFWVIVAALLWVFLTRYEDLQALAETLTQGQWQWVVLAAGLEVGYIVSYTAAFQTAYSAAGIMIQMWDVLPVFLGSMVLDAVSPVGSAAGVALFIDDALRRGYSAMRVTAGLVLQAAADLSTLTLILVMGSVYMYSLGELQMYGVVGTGVLILVTAGLVSVLMLGVWRPSSVERVFGWFQRMINRMAALFGSDGILSEDWAEKSAVEYTNASEAVAQHPRRLFRLLVAMFGVHALSIAGLQALFAAFHHPIEIGTLMVAYAVGLLVWMTSPVPQGTGLIEGAMALTFVTLGVPWDVAITVTLAYRGLTFWLPLLLGLVLLRKVKTFEVEETDLGESGGVFVLTVLVAGMGLLNVLTALSPTMTGLLAPLTRVSPLFVDVPLAGLLSGLCLMILARGLRFSKRLAWLITFSVFIVAGAAHLIYGPNYGRALLSAALALWLLFLGTYFEAQSDPIWVRRGLLVLMGAFIFVLVYGFVGFYILSMAYGNSFDPITALGQSTVMFIFYPPQQQWMLGPTRYFIYSIYLLSVAAWGFALAAALKPMRVRYPPTEVETQRAKKIIESHGRSSMAYFALLEDKYYYFSNGGSLIAYTVLGRVAVTLGDPIGPCEDVTTAVASFHLFCKRNGWIPSFCLTMPDFLEQYQQAGFSFLCLGYEAIIDLKTFNISGRASSNYRKRYNRMRRQGYRLVFHEPPLSDELVNELRAISDQWLEMVPGGERRFFLGWFDEEYVRNGLVAAVHTPEGQISAFTNLVPEYQLNEITIDLVRRKEDMLSGTMDFLFVSLFFWAREQGYDTFNMGLSALSRVGHNRGDPILEKLIHFIYENGNWFYSFKGLHGFMNKFQPQWEPQYLVYPSLISLPAVWWAMARANTGDGFPWEYLEERIILRRS